MRQKKNYMILTFKTTTAAMAMEKKCSEEGIPGRLIPLPGEISAGCGLSWRILPEEYETYKDKIMSLDNKLSKCGYKTEKYRMTKGNRRKLRKFKEKFLTRMIAFVIICKCAQ